MAPNQSVLAVCSWPTLPGACCSTAARNSCAFSIDGSRVTVEADAVPVYSNLGPAPCWPRLVVMRTTPLAALVP
jgi:hypothetical protein